MGQRMSLQVSFFTAFICYSIFILGLASLNENHTVTEGDIVNLRYDNVDISEIGTIALIRTYSDSSTEETLIVGTTPTSSRLPEALSRESRFMLIQEQLSNENLKVHITILDVKRQDDAIYSLVGYAVRLFLDRSFHQLCAIISQLDPHIKMPAKRITVNFPPNKPTCEVQDNVLLCCHEYARPSPSAHWYVNGNLCATKRLIKKGNDVWCTEILADNLNSNFTCELISKGFPEYKESCTVNNTALNFVPDDTSVSSRVAIFPLFYTVVYGVISMHIVYA